MEVAKLREFVCLNSLPMNTYGIIDGIHCTGNIKRRILDLGMIKGTKIKPVLKSPSGDPIAYEVRGSIIAIRKEDSDKISVLI